MEPQDYSPFADLLNKFHTAAPTIQALWLAALLLIGWHLASLAGRVLVEIISFLDRRDARRVRTEYTIYREADGR